MLHPVFASGFLDINIRIGNDGVLQALTFERLYDQFGGAAT